MSDQLTDRYGRTISVGDHVVYGTRVGNVAKTRVALVTKIVRTPRDMWNWRTQKYEPGFLTEVTAESLNDDGEYGRASKPTVSNLLRYDVPE